MRAACSRAPQLIATVVTVAEVKAQQQMCSQHAKWTFLLLLMPCQQEKKEKKGKKEESPAAEEQEEKGQEEEEEAAQANGESEDAEGKSKSREGTPVRCHMRSCPACCVPTAVLG